MSEKEKEVKKPSAPKKPTAPKKPSAPKKPVADADKKVKKENKEAKAKEEPKVEEKVEKKTEKKTEKVKGPKKTKAEINREIKENINKENAGASKKDKNRAEKAARRDAKLARKDANTVKEKSERLSNGVLAIIIFGVIFAMFAFVWGYQYFGKEASIEKYLNTNGGSAVFSSIKIDNDSTASISAEGNKMYVTITNSAEDTSKATKYYKSKNGRLQMKYIASYFLASMKPNCRGLSASATCVAKVGKKKVSTEEVKYSEVDDILGQFGLSIESIQKQMNESSEETTTTE